MTGEGTPIRLRGGWWVLRDPENLVLARRWPPMFDLAASDAFPACARLRLAQQIRQDLWRALQNVRGFSPVVAVARADGGLWVTAGGRCTGAVPATAGARAAALLADPGLRRRWVKNARR